jgi:hypothetical protein
MKLAKLWATSTRHLVDVLKSVLMATLHASANRILGDAYHDLLDDLDDDKEVTFTLMQQACARQFRRLPDRESRPDTPRRDSVTQRTSPDKPDIKYECQGAHGPDPCNKYTRQGDQDGGQQTTLFRNGNLTLALAGWWHRLWARSGCGGPGPVRMGGVVFAAVLLWGGV